MHVAIVGAGIAGLATAWGLVSAGHRVTLLEQGDAVPHGLSASGDHHRLIRRAYLAEEGYAPLITEAFGAWDVLWRDLGRSHYRERGVLIVSQSPDDEAARLADALRVQGFAAERFGPDDAAARYPFLDPDSIREVVLNHEGGALMCRGIASDLAAWLVARGVEIRVSTQVRAIDAQAARVVCADGTVLQADRVVATAGGWVLRLFPELADRLRVFRTAVAYLEPPADLAEAWTSAPAILDVGGSVDGYLLPPVDGLGVKVGAGVHKRPSFDPDADRSPRPGEGEQIRDYFGPPLARIGEYRPSAVATCVYTFTEDHRFWCERRGRTWIVSACSGHAYKFGAAIGRRVARAVEAEDEAGLAAWLRAEVAA